MSGPLARRIEALTAERDQAVATLREVGRQGQEALAERDTLADRVAGLEARATRYAKGLRTYHAHAAEGPRPNCEPDKYVACEAEAWLTERAT